MSLSPLEESRATSLYSPPSLLARRAPQWKWNPYTDGPLPSLLTSGLVAEEAMSIPALVEKYEQQVASLLKTHEEIMFLKGRVQEVVSGLHSFANASGVQSEEEHTLQLAERNSELDLLKQGLHIRLRQFDDDCQNASKLEWVLRRKLSTPEDTGKFVQTVQPLQVQPTCEAMKKIQDQDRLIKLLQHVLDQNLYHNYTFAEGLCQMRRECFTEELENSGAIQADSAWFEGKTIQFTGKEGPQIVSSWMRMIRTHPTKEQIPPPPRADPHSLRFVSKVQEIDQLASAVIEEGRKVATLKKEPNVKELLCQLSQLRNVLAGATAAASGIEKVTLNELTTHVEQQISYPSHAAARAEAQEGASDGKPPQVVRMTKATASDNIPDGGRDQAPYTADLTLVERKSKHEALTVAGMRRASSRASLRDGQVLVPLAGGRVLSRPPSRTLASPRRSRTSVLGVEGEEPKSVTAASREDTLSKRKPSLSRSVSSHPQSPPLSRGASRTVPSPRQSFSELLPAQSDRREMTGKTTEDEFFSFQQITGVKQGSGGDREERQSADVSARLNGALSRAGSRTVPSPRKTLSRSSLTLRSPRDLQTPLSPTPLSRAMSSAFLGS